ncbi:hypothetical protein H2198_000524 [Neophaeococcomyces mojaviensis]|uniref:Uncharacterized protein n=1 Tax=Neophaeococcomyces mojaviensis TaxID=3383035 RepID=A0ACC3AK94_9EURO|nr:hypothetical protein H2198_000524 [Knufia sp. JES_112]
MAGIRLFLTLLSALLAVAQAIPTISITGSKFFTSDGKQFYVKGVAYQLIEDDPLVDTAQCQRDAALMHTLGANSIRVYHVNATADHSGCMNAFAQNGIYIWVDLDSFKTYIRLDDVPSWTQNKSDSYRAVMDNFAQFENTAGFFIGNEVLNSLQDSGSAPYLLSAAADLRAYGESKQYRTIPIGYSATDTGALPMLQDYLVCRPNATERLDFYALNSYRWCGQSSFQTSGYINLLNASANYPVPIFFSEDGCITVPPRTFTDQAAIFGPDMADTWSGAIIYEWIQETNAYGLIQYGPRQDASVNDDSSSIIEGFTRQGTPTPIAPDFTNLQSQWATLNPTGVDSKAYAATIKTTAPSCPPFTAGGWTVDPSAALPTLGQAAISGMTTGLPGTIPSGSITVVATTGSGPGTENGPESSLNPISSNPDLPYTGGSSATAASSSASASSSATSKAAGVRTISKPVNFDEVTVFRTFMALAGISLGAMVWL